MKTTLYDYEFKNAEKAIQSLINSIYCKNCSKEGKKFDNIEIPEAREFVYAVLEEIGIEY